MAKKNNPREIAAFVNNRAVCYMEGKLACSSPEHAPLHRRNEKDEKGFRLRDSLVGISVVDYSKEPSVCVSENITPAQLKELYSEAGFKRSNYEFSGNATKIYGEPDAEGFSKTSKLTITRQSIYKDKPNPSPWFIGIENGRGKKAKNEKTGGTYCQGGTYVCDKKAFINLTDGDFFTLISDAVTYVTAWEQLYGARHVKDNLEYAAEHADDYKNR